MMHIGSSQSLHQVTFLINLHADLLLLNQEPGPLSIEAESSSHFEMRVLSRAVGQLPIRITAQVVETNIRDAVEKPLNVKVSNVGLHCAGQVYTMQCSATYFNLSFSLPYFGSGP